MSKNNTYLLALNKILKNHHREESGNQQEDADFEVQKASVAAIIAAMAQDKLIFSLRNILYKIIHSRVGKIWPWTKSGWQLVLQIKFYWNMTACIHFYVVYCCFQAIASELSRYNRDYMQQSLKYLLYSPLQKVIANP